MGLRIMSQLAAQARCSGASSSGSNGGSSSDGEVAPVGERGRGSGGRHHT